MKKTTQFIIYGFVAIGIIAMITSAISIWSVKKVDEKNKEEIRLQEEERIASALNDLEQTARYQKYCTEGVIRIDTAGDYVKIISNKAGDSITYYKEDSHFYCPVDLDKAVYEECDAIKELNFKNTFACSSRAMNAAVGSGSGLRIQTQETGTAVIVDRVVLEAPGFVVIYSQDNKNQPATIISHSSLLKRGVSDIVSIAMPQPMKNQQLFQAGLSLDNGDGEFATTTDTIVQMDTKSMLLVPFIAKK